MLFSAVLALHIGCGTLGLLSGAAAIAVRKGSRNHRLIGNVFVLSMLGLAVSAVYLATVKHQIPNVLGGTFTFYLVATAWLTAHRSDGRTDIGDWAGLLLVLTLMFAYFTYGLEASQSPTGLKYGYRPGLYFFSALLAMLAAAGDVRMLVRGGISGTQRLLRHIWRMCWGLFVASGSIFLARPHLFPVLLRKMGVLVVLGFLPLLCMIFWLLRVRFARKYWKKLVADRTLDAPQPLSQPSLTNRYAGRVSL